MSVVINVAVVIASFSLAGIGFGFLLESFLRVKDAPNVIGMMAFTISLPVFVWFSHAPFAALVVVVIGSVLGFGQSSIWSRRVIVSEVRNSNMSRNLVERYNEISA